MLSILRCSGQLLRTQHCLVQNGNAAKVEKLSFKPIHYYCIVILYVFTYLKVSDPLSPASVLLNHWDTTGSSSQILLSSPQAHNLFEAVSA